MTEVDLNIETYIYKLEPINCDLLDIDFSQLPSQFIFKNKAQYVERILESVQCRKLEIVEYGSVGFKGAADKLVMNIDYFRHLYVPGVQHCIKLVANFVNLT